MPEPPLVLDRYRLVERLAVGGSAEVWRAHDEQLDRAVAVKRLHPHLLPDAVSRQRLAAEARAAAGLSHPGIVGIYDVDTTGDWPALVMELVDGESLASRLAREGPLAEREAAAVAADIADGLYHAHKRGIVHRDVKPGNVLLDRAGRARLADFGIARSLAESAERLTQTGSVMGTLRYMAPEQLTGGEIGPRTDLYGLGAVLHEALTGEPPFPAGSPVGLVEAQRAGPPTIPAIDPALAALISACLAYDPGGPADPCAGGRRCASRLARAADPAPRLRRARAIRTQTMARPVAPAPVVTPRPGPQAPAVPGSGSRADRRHRAQRPGRRRVARVWGAVGRDPERGCLADAQHGANAEPDAGVAARPPRRVRAGVRRRRAATRRERSIRGRGEAGLR